MTLDFIEHHRQNYFCTVYYLAAKDAKNYLMLTIRAGLKPMQPMQLHWAPRHGVWVDHSFSQIYLALENSVETPYKFYC